MKWETLHVINDYILSPSMRREWIEMHHVKHPVTDSESPSMRREWIEIF